MIKNNKIKKTKIIKRKAFLESNSLKTQKQLFCKQLKNFKQLLRKLLHLKDKKIDKIKLNQKQEKKYDFLQPTYFSTNENVLLC